MKSKIFFLLSFFLLIFCNAHAQSRISRFKEIEKKNLIKINILSPFIGTLSIQNERIINSESSIQLGFYYFSGLIFGTANPVNAICFTPEYRLYLVNDAPRGFYIQPYIRVGRFWQDKNPNSKIGTNFNGAAAGIVFGKQWIWGNKFSFDMYIGPLYSKVFFDDSHISTTDLPLFINGYWFRGGITFGYYLK